MEGLRKLVPLYLLSPLAIPAALLLNQSVLVAAGPSCREKRPVAAEATDGSVVWRLTAAPGMPRPGEEFELAVLVEMGGSPYALGSYGAVLRWDPVGLEFLGVTGGRMPGFSSPIINQTDAPTGDLRFAEANPLGATGTIEVLRARFRSRRAIPRLDQVFDLQFSSMATIGPRFENLLPILGPEPDRRQGVPRRERGDG